MSRLLVRATGALLVALWMGSAFANEATPTLADPVAAKREVELAAQLRCLVCQNQSIAESNAPLAADLRKQLREQIEAGRTDAQIVEYMTARYGDFVLYKPPFKPETLVLWFGPAILLVIGGFVLARTLRARRVAAATNLSAQDHERAASLLAGAGKGAGKP